MIVGPLKSNTRFSITILLVVSLLLWINTILFTSANVVYSDNKAHILYDLLFNDYLSATIQHIISLVIILLGALFVNFLTVNQEITSKTNFLPAFLYILFAFSSSSNTVIEPILVANLFVLPAFYFLTSSYRVDNALSQVFKAGLCMGIAWFFCIDYTILFFLMYIALLILRPFNWREVVVMTIGLMVSLYIYMCVCYLSNANSFMMFHFIADTVHHFEIPSISEFYIAFVLISVLFLVFACIHYLNKGFGAKVKTQKTKQILFWMIGLITLMMFFEREPDSLLMLGIVPLSIIIGDYIAEVKQLKIANTLLLLFIGGFMMMYLHVLGTI